MISWGVLLVLLFSSFLRYSVPLEIILLPLHLILVEPGPELWLGYLFLLEF